MSSAVHAEWARAYRRYRRDEGLSLAQASAGICTPRQLDSMERGLRSARPAMRNRLFSRLALDRTHISGAGAVEALIAADEAFTSADYEKAEALLAPLTDTIHTRLQHAKIQHHRGQYDEAETAYSALLADSSLPDWFRFRVQASLCLLYVDCADLPKSRQIGEQALQESRALTHIELDDLCTLRGTLTNAYANISDFQRGHELADQNLGVRHPNKWQQVTFAWAKATVLFYEGRDAEASEVMQVALRAARGLYRPVTHAMLTYSSTMIDVRSGRIDAQEACNNYKIAYQVLMDAGAVVLAAPGLGMIAEMEVILGNEAAARDAIAQAYAQLDSLDSKTGGDLLCELARVHARLGEIPETRAALQQASLRLETAGYDRWAAILWRQMADLYESMDDIDLAVTCIKASNDLVGIRSSPFRIS